jgi:hypothetical protein
MDGFFAGWGQDFKAFEITEVVFQDEDKQSGQEILDQTRKWQVLRRLNAKESVFFYYDDEIFKVRNFSALQGILLSDKVYEGA